MKKKGYYEYDPVIYPRKLWVAVGLDLDTVKALFTTNDGNEIEIGDEDFLGLTLFEMKRRKDLKLGEFVLFVNKKYMTMGVCCHEASHVCDAIEQTIGMEHGDEPSAYLLGWIASCINKARLGIGDFIEIEERD